MVPFCLYSIIHIISIFFNYSFGDDISRVMAAINTAVLWMIGSIVFSIILKCEINERKVNKIMFYNLMFIIILSLIALFLKDILFKNISIGNRQLIGADWIYEEKTYRFLGFFEYSNLVVLFTILIFPFAMKYVSITYNRQFQLIFCILSLIPTFLTNSRAGIILISLLIFSTIPKILSLSKKSNYIIIIFLVFFFFFFMIFNFNTLLEKFLLLINSRENSTSMRMKIYSESINITLNKNIFIGCGIKEYLSGYPLGSHSTYIGLFYKVGILGCFIILYGIYQLVTFIISSIKRENSYFLMSFLCLLVMLSVEDLDGTNWYIIFFFCMISIFIKTHKFTPDKKNDF